MLELRDLVKEYPGGRGRLRAADGVTLSVEAGESFGVVGESGCGKSTLARLILGLEKPTSGEIRIDGERVDRLTERQRRPKRSACQLVFQDSGSSLNPRRRVLGIIGDPMLRHGLCARSEVRQAVDRLIEQVGLPKDSPDRYPHEFSGGQRQRICIARALGLAPKLLVLDEPVSALDVSAQAQILNLLRDLQRSLGLTYLFIGHGLGAVHYIADRIAVMYLGRIVELGPSDALFASPLHPYTAALLDAAPSADYALRDRPRIALKGDIEGTGRGAGCPFRDRCPAAEPACARIEPALAEAAPGRWSACCRGSGLTGTTLNQKENP